MNFLIALFLYIHKGCLEIETESRAESALFHVKKISGEGNSIHLVTQEVKLRLNNNVHGI